MNSSTHSVESKAYELAEKQDFYNNPDFYWSWAEKLVNIPPKIHRFIVKNSNTNSGNNNGTAV